MDKSLRRSKRKLAPVYHLEPSSTQGTKPESPIKKRRPATNVKGQTSQPQRSQPGDDSQLSTYGQTLGALTLTEHTILSPSARLTVDTRASSPTRTKKDLESAVPKIICREFTFGKSIDREDIQLLRKKLAEVARGRGILPLSLHDTLFPLLNEWIRDESDFDDFPRSKEQEDEIWKAIQKLRIKAQKCGERDKPESSWSHEVIRPLIEYALEYTPWQDTINVEIVWEPFCKLP